MLGEWRLPESRAAVAGGTHSIEVRQRDGVSPRPMERWFQDVALDVKEETKKVDVADYPTVEEKADVGAAESGRLVASGKIF